MKKTMIWFLMLVSSFSYGKNKNEQTNLIASKISVISVPDEMLPPVNLQTPFKYTLLIEKDKSSRNRSAMIISGNGVVGVPVYSSTHKEIPYVKECINLEEKKNSSCSYDKLKIGKDFKLLIEAKKNNPYSFIGIVYFEDIDLIKFREHKTPYGTIEIPTTRRFYVEESFKLNRKRTTVKIKSNYKNKQILDEYTVTLIVEE